MRSYVGKHIILTIFSFIELTILPVYAQNRETYVARTTHSERSVELIQFFKDQYKVEAGNFKSEKTKKLLKRQSDLLVQLVEKEAFIKDETLQSFIENTFTRIIETNIVTNPPRYILISKNPEVNAFYSYLNVIVINVGLLARFNSEAELAFVIAHELAHGELNHIRRKIHKQSQTATMAKKEIKKFKKGDISSQGIDILQNIAYENGNFSRKMEIEADSLGYIYLLNANFNPSGALKTISLLDSAAFPKYPLGYRLLQPFHSKHYPIKAEWLKNKPSGLTKKPEFTLFYKTDSLNSHPEYLERAARFNALTDQKTYVTQKKVNELAAKAIKLAEFEAIESSYFMRKLDRCIYYALQLKARYPNNNYPISMITKAFLRLYEVKSYGKFPIYVSTYTGHYKGELKKVNHFLSNLQAEEMLEIAYHFLGSSRNFDDNHQEHYFLLWRLAKITNRAEVQTKITSAYQKKFPSGDFINKMK